MDFNRRNVIKTLRNGQIVSTSSSVTSLTSSKPSVLTGNYLPATSNGDGTYLVDLSKVQFTGSIVAYGEVTAYGSAESGGSTTIGNVTIYDGLDSTDPAVALSANQGRILKELIGEGGGSIEKLTDVELVNLADGQILKYDVAKGHWVNGDGTKVTWENIEGKPEGLTDEKLQQIIDFKADDYLLKSVWDSVFTIDSSGNLRVKPNLVGEKEISAYGAGSSSGSGGVTIYDGLDSTSTDVALSANQGRYLKSLIDNIDVGNVDLSNYYTKTQVDDLIDDVNPTWSNISGKPTFATVATSGSYNDLSNKPTIPTNTNQLTNGAGFITSSDSRLSDARPASDVYSWAKASSKPSYSWSEITSKPSFATVATSGKYSDLSGKPTIPTNNNQLTNGAGYITSSGSISGNAGSATKLATSRTLWGQSFNGSANVSGAMTGVTTITASGAISCGSLKASGEVTAHSDKRLKSDIKPLEVRGELNPVTYVKDGKESIGFIADEVKEVYPELVITDESTEEKYLSLNYQQLTAVLYAEIKELKNQIKELNEKVRTMAN